MNCVLIILRGYFFRYEKVKTKSCFRAVYFSSMFSITSYYQKYDLRSNPSHLRYFWTWVRSRFSGISVQRVCISYSHLPKQIRLKEQTVEQFLKSLLISLPRSCDINTKCRSQTLLGDNPFSWAQTKVRVSTDTQQTGEGSHVIWSESSADTDAHAGSSTISPLSVYKCPLIASSLHSRFISPRCITAQHSHVQLTAHWGPLLWEQSELPRAEAGFCLPAKHKAVEPELLSPPTPPPPPLHSLSNSWQTSFIRRMSSWSPLQTK